MVFNRDSFLYNEPDLLLREELREPRLYAALLRAIAQGHHQVRDITRAAGFADRATATRYLDTLRGLGLVERRQPPQPGTAGPRRRRLPPATLDLIGCGFPRDELVLSGLMDLARSRATRSLTDEECRGYLHEKTERPGGYLQIYSQDCVI